MSQLHRLVWIALLGTIGCAAGCNLSKSLRGVDSHADLTTYEDPGVWAEHTAGMPFVLGYQAGMSKAREQGKPAMVFLTSTSCKWCKKLSEECFQNPQIRSALQENFVLVLVDGESERNVKRTLRAVGYPTLVFVSPEEQILATQNGFAQPEILKSVITLAMQSGPPRRGPANATQVAQNPQGQDS